MAGPEARLKERCYKALKRLRTQIQRRGGDLEFMKMHGSAAQRRGEPDLIVDLLCFPHEVHARIELKAPEGVVTPLQTHRLMRWQAAGCTVGVARSVDELLEILDPNGSLRSLLVDAD